jgi:hypothetical protein
VLLKLRTGLVFFSSRHRVGTGFPVEYFIDSSFTAFSNRAFLAETRQTRAKTYIKIVKSIIPTPMETAGIQTGLSTDTKRAATIINTMITSKHEIEIKVNSISQGVDRRARLILANDCSNSYG